MTNRLEMNRRQFVVSTAAIGGGMAIGVGLPGLSGTALAAPGDVNIGDWIVINADSSITVRYTVMDIGIGSAQVVAQMICEELSCDWSKVKTAYATPDASFKTQVFKGKAFALSDKRPSANVELMLQAGASARERLIAAAAAELNVPAAQLEAKEGFVVHATSNRRLPYGQLATKAAAIKLDKEPDIKSPDKFTFLGKSMPIVPPEQALLKVSGRAIYTIDVKVPNMLQAAVKAAPVFGAKLKPFDPRPAMERPGVRHVVELGKVNKASAARAGSALRSGVAVLADTWWQAKTALDLLTLEWDEGAAGKTSTDSMLKAQLALLDKPGKPLADGKKGDAEAALKSASKVYEAVYETPFLDHVVMEPMGTLAHYTPEKLELWVGTQNPGNTVLTAAEESGLPDSKIVMHEVFAGGSYGRRGTDDDTRQAVALSMAVNRPVKLTWSREETTRQGEYRKISIAKFWGALGPDGMPAAMQCRYVGVADATTVGVISNMEYAVPNYLVDYHFTPTHVPVGSLRAPNGNQNAQMIEGFLDELCAAGGKDPVEVRRHLLRNAKDPGWLKVLNDVADKSGWGKKTFPKGTAQGIAMALDHGTIIAGVSTVTVTREGEVKIDQVDVSFDLGTVYNPNGVRAMMEGAVVYGMNHLMNEEITIRNGRVIEGNFDDYPIMRIDQAPVVNTHFGGNTGGIKVAKAGEPGVTVAAASALNAIYRATGKRIRSTPLRKHDLSWS